MAVDVENTQTLPTRAKLRFTTPILSEAVDHENKVEIRPVGHCIFKSGKIGVRFWASSPNTEEFEHRLDIDETVATYDILTQEPPCDFYQVQLSDIGRENSLVPLLGEFGGTFIDGKRADGQWIVKLCFPDRPSFQSFFETFDSYTSVSVQLDKVVSENSLDRQNFGLTPSQQNAFRVAYEQGYFDIPRKATLDSLADELNVSDQAVSERLRRAQKRVCDRIFDEQRQ